MNKNQKGFAPIIIALIVLVLAGAGGTGYYLINKQVPKQTACTTEAKICPDGSSVGRTGPNCEFAACPEVKTGETTNLKTYKDEEYGFSFKYPAEYEVIKDTSYNIKYKIIGKNGFEQILYIDGSNFPSDSRFKELLEWRPETWISSKSITLNGYDAVEVLEDDYGKIIKEIYIGKGNLVIAFQFNLDSLESKISPEKQSILDSFKFIGRSDDKCESWLKECAKEGETNCGPCGCQNCCLELINRNITYPYRNKNNEPFCLEEMASSVCVKCGDKICGKGEDWCVCPEDCSKPNPEDLHLILR